MTCGRLWSSSRSRCRYRPRRAGYAGGEVGTAGGTGRCTMGRLLRLRGAKGSRPPWAALRWAAPGGVAIAVGAVLAGTMLASAAAPNLPRQTPAQLLAAVRQAELPAAMSATLSESANLGFPALPDVGGASSSPLSLASLISGTRTIQIWY